MRSLVLALTIFGLLPLALVKPHIGVFLFSWVSYMNPHRLTFGFTFDFPFAQVIGIVTAVAWVISLEKKRIPLTATSVFLVLLAAWVTVTTQFAEFPISAEEKWDRSIKILLFNGILSLAIINTKRRIIGLVWIIVISLGFYGARGGFFTILTGGQFRVFGPFGSFIADNNQLALALVMTLPLMRFLHLSTTSRIVRIGMAVLLLLTVVAILGSQSRGAFVALAVVGWALLARSRGKLGLALAGILVISFGLAFFPDQWWARMSSIVDFQADTSAQGRLEAWAFAIETAIRKPMFGGGFGVFDGNLSELCRASSGIGACNAHSIYFEVLGEQGFAGLALFLGLALSALVGASRIARTAHGSDDFAWASDLAHMLQISLVGYLVNGIFLNLAFFDLFYHVAILVPALGAVVRAGTAQDTSPGISLDAEPYQASPDRNGGQRDRFTVAGTREHALQ